MVKAYRNFVQQMSDHDDLLQSVCWTVVCVAFVTAGLERGDWEAEVRTLLTYVAVFTSITF